MITAELTKQEVQDIISNLEYKVGLDTKHLDFLLNLSPALAADAEKQVRGRLHTNKKRLKYFQSLV